LKHHGSVYGALADTAHIAGLAIWRMRRVIQHKAELDPPHFLQDLMRHSIFERAARR
jgi:hypothetical protein